MTQLSARLSETVSHLQTVLHKLILKTTNEHPHHLIPILFALKSAATDVSKEHPVTAETKVLDVKVVLFPVFSLRLFLANSRTFYYPALMITAMLAAVITQL